MTLGPSQNIGSYRVWLTLEGQSTHFGAIWEVLGESGGPEGAQGGSREVQGEPKGVPRAQKGDKMEPRCTKSLPQESTKVTKWRLRLLKIEVLVSDTGCSGPRMRLRHGGGKAAGDWIFLPNWPATTL